MLKLSQFLTAAILAAYSLTGSAQGYGQSDAPASQARAPLQVKTGKVLDLQTVRIDVPPTNTAGTLGGVIGAAAGAFMARDGSWQSQALAGTIGAAVGNKVANTASAESREAVQVIVKLDDGQALAIIQEPNGAPLQVGQSVYVIGQHPAVRVMAAR